ncbi:MAG: hypothetical protein NVS3B14_03000 [Ktedonobacteraceae bacterium]
MKQPTAVQLLQVPAWITGRLQLKLNEAKEVSEAEDNPCSRDGSQFSSAYHSPDQRASRRHHKSSDQLSAQGI